MRRTVWVCLAAAILTLFALAIIVGLAGPAAAKTAASWRSAAPSASPTVVGELTGLRTATSSTYLLSNGLRRAQISAAPIHFKDAQGSWQSFDTSLTAAAAPGSYRARLTPFAATLTANPYGAAAATLTYGGYAIGLQLTGVNENGGIALGSALNFPALTSATTESYRILNGGLEQSINLASAEAPDSFTCLVSHRGLSLRKDARGTWGFYEPGKASPLAELSPILVSDSSKGAAGLPAYCDGATMTVSPGEGHSTLTYTVPRSWLTSAARVYPVQIDPICYFPNFFPSVDTTVSSGSPNSAFGAATQLNAGYDGTGYWRTLVRFDLTSIPQNSYVEDTDLQLYKSASGGSNGATTVGVMNEAFSGSSTWNSLGCVVNSLPAGFSTTLGSVAGQASGTWNDFWLASVAHAVQRWVSGAQANDGFVLSQDESGAQGAAYLAGYLSQEYGGNDDAPDLWVSYETAPTVTVSCDNTNYRIGATVAVTMRLDSHYASDQWEQQIAINKAGGVQGNYRGLMGLFWFDPNASHADGVSWVTYALGGQYSGSYLAYEAPPGTTYGTQYITPNWPTPPLPPAGDYGAADI